MYSEKNMNCIDFIFCCVTILKSIQFYFKLIGGVHMDKIESLMMSNLCRYKRLNEKKMEAVTHKYDLRKIDVDIIIFLANSGDKDTAKDIASTERFTKGHISQSVKRLTEKGFISTIQDKNDLRVQHLKLEEPARVVLGEMLKIKNSIDECVFNGVTEEERSVLKNVSAKMYDNITKELSK